ncbi:MAG: chorismate synthase [candidate division Zixibacteria bacterium]
MPRYLTAGESHGRGIIGLVESFPAGIPISLKKINEQLGRRQQGYGRGGRMKIEKDKVNILSGLRHGKTLGSPITLEISNKDWSNWKKIMDPMRSIGRNLSPMQKKRAYDVTAPRPGHIDLAGAIKYNQHDLRNVLERASARETAARVACGAIARQLLEYFDINIASHVISIGKAKISGKKIDFDLISGWSDASPVRCVDTVAEKKMIAVIKQAMKNRDTLGGVFEVRVCGLPTGLGNNAQWYQKIDSQLAATIMSIQSVKGVEIGKGFSNAGRFGSKVHDIIYYDSPDKHPKSKGFYRKTNRAGGIEGGLTNGSELIVRGACKPISTLMRPLDTVDIICKEAREAIVERSDICVVPAAAIVGEAMVAMVLADAFLDKFGGDNLAEIETNYESYLNTDF